MILYHGSARKLKSLKRRQATAGEGIEVPKGELLNGIYFTPDIGFAVAIAGMPSGAAHIDETKKTVEFENPSEFDPEKKIFVYQVDTEKLPGLHFEKVDEQQYVVTGENEVYPESYRELKAGEVMKYYQLINWEGFRDEMTKEFGLK
ncbi:MAG TPA: hypothetical protein VFT82_01725 [Candidatus Paceibacterota bacterium]|nr:hypothetical protein [Candidatus Paceibacterota bacterium]